MTTPVTLALPPVVEISPTGVQGPRGNAVLNGAGAPAPTTGVDGDWYIDTTTPTALIVYGPKTSGTWPTPGLTLAGAIAVLLAANNLSDLTNPTTARQNLGLGNTATRNVGTTTGTVAAGDDSRITGALQSGATAGGDLTGTLPNPTVAKVNGVAVTGTPAAGQVPTATSGTAATWQPLPAASTSTSGVVRLDGTAADIAPLGTQAAGSVGKAADAGHVHAMPRLDQMSAPTAAVSMNGQKLTSVASGTAAGDAVNVAQIPNPATVIQAAAPTGVAATDQAAISAAVAALPAGGGVVQLQAGTYVVPAPASSSSGCISMGVNSSVLRGMGMGVTTIQLAPGSTGVTGIVRTPSAVQNSKITFQDFTIDGNAANQTGSPIVIGFFCGVTPNSTLTDTDITLVRVEAMNCIGYGFDPHERTTRLTMIGCVSHDNGSDNVHDGFTLDACYDTVLIGCKAYNNGRHGFNLVTASTRVQLIGCEAYSNGANGFTAQNGAKYAQFTGCMAYSNTAAGFVINGLPQTGQQDNTPGGMHTLSGCTAWSNGTHNYQLVGASYNRLTGCHSQDASQAATNTSDHYRIDETGTTYSTTNTLTSCTWAQTTGVANAAKYGVQEKTANDGPTFILGCSGAGTTTGAVRTLNGTSSAAAAHNGTTGGHPPTFAYADDSPGNHGLTEWNGQSKYAGVSTAAITAGVANFTKITTQSGGSFSTAWINLRGTAPATLANTYVGLYDASGNLLVASADQSSAWNATTGNKQVPLGQTFTPAAGTVYFVAVLVGSAGTLPTLSGFSVSGASLAGLGQSTSFSTPYTFGSFGTALTALPATFTITGNSAVTFWCGLQ